MRTVPAVTASDVDGDLHLVALTDDVAGWRVTVTDPAGTTRDAGTPEPFLGDYYPALLMRPSWHIDRSRLGGSWELAVDGERARIEGSRAG